MRPLLLLLLPLSLASTAAEAQIIRRGSLGSPPPAAWAGLAVAQTGSWRVNDGTTGSVWEFGSATQYHASLEKSMSGVSVGVRGTHARVPLRYGSLTGGPTVEADANVSQLFGSVHVASGRGFHSVLELDAGATHYSNFRARGTGERLGATGDTDFTFSFGYGFGYGFSNRFAVEVVQELATVMHQRTGLSGGEDTNDRISSTRIAGRWGLGQRR